MLIAAMTSANLSRQLVFFSNYTSNGIVISKMFMLESRFSWQGASDACVERRMRLFQMTSPEAAEAVFARARLRYLGSKCLARVLTLEHELVTDDSICLSMFMKLFRDIE
jgi:hypothetical protein